MEHGLQKNFPQPIFKQKDKRIKIFIWTVSVIIFLIVASLSGIKLNLNLNFNPHIFATINAVINSIVAVLLLLALLAVKSGKYFLHKKLMLTAITLSVLFLLSYVCHHLLSGDTKFGDINHDGIVSADEKTAAGFLRYVYYFILITHIPLAGIILPFILFTAYRALSGNYENHKKLARITWPVWMYVAISGVVVYLMISPYYS